MALKKITENDLAGKGVIGMADTPNLSAREMQEKVEEVVRAVVIPFINANVDETVSKQELAETVFKLADGDLSEFLMPKGGGEFTGNVSVAEGKYIDFKTVNGSCLRILGSTAGDLAVFRLIGADGNTVSELLMVNTATGEIVTSTLMPKSGGIFTDKVKAKSGITDVEAQLRNIKVCSNAGVANVNRVATYEIMMVRK